MAPPGSGPQLRRLAVDRGRPEPPASVASRGTRATPAFHDQARRAALAWADRGRSNLLDLVPGCCPDRTRRGFDAWHDEPGHCGHPWVGLARTGIELAPDPRRDHRIGIGLGKPGSQPSRRAAGSALVHALRALDLI